MISFIIPTLNEEKTIAKTLKSLKKLTDFEYEIIVSDGRSVDKTIEIAQEHAHHVVIYEGTARQTIGHARNLGATRASKNYYVFIDADVTIPNINAFFKECLRAFEKDKRLVGLTVSLKTLPEVATWADIFFFKMTGYTFYLLNNLLHFGGSSGEFQMIKSEAFKKMGGFNEKLAVAEDNELFSRLARHGRTHIILDLHILHTARRAHKIGWHRLLASWWVNWLSVTFFKRSWHSVWKEIR